MCNGTSSGGWMRVGHLDMTNSSQECPGDFDLFTHEEQRYCYRRDRDGCGSVIYSTYGVEYSQVCGRVTAYQVDTTSAFFGYSHGGQISLEGVYVDGVSVTYGDPPRQHIWTFASAMTEARSDERVCPCTNTNSPYTGSVPPFIGEDYFCDTAVTTSNTPSGIFFNDPLWDGLGCGPTSSCCTFNDPPWFCKKLSDSTKDSIELRICNFAQSPLVRLIEMNIK